MTKLATRAILIAGLCLLTGGGCRPRPGSEGSSGSNWLECETLADCSAAEEAVACKGGYCRDAEGEAVALESSALDCRAEPYRGTCVEERAAAYFDGCLDGDGACAWTLEVVNGEYVNTFEWENGARTMEGTLAGSFRGIGSSGITCTSLREQTLECTSRRIEVDGLWYRECVQYDAEQETVSYRFDCDDGERFELAAEELVARRPPMCAEATADLYAGCVDVEGRSYSIPRDEPWPRGGEPWPRGCAEGFCEIAKACHANGTRGVAAPDDCNTCDCEDGRIVCTQLPCSRDLGGYCDREFPCREGYFCRDNSPDMSGKGYCTVGCDEAACPDGTECVQTEERVTGEPDRTCLRRCTTQADCAPVSGVCIGFYCL
jgi:hypothetical protein